ncbi:MAG: hypothetical protein ACM3SU_15045 [Acidobacteriota bacterium]
MIPFTVMIAVIGAIVAGLAYFVFVRPMPTGSRQAVIARKTFAPAHAITRYDASSAARRQYWSQQRFTIPDSWVFELQIDGVADAATFSLEKSAGEAFQLGQRVRVKYQERGIPPFWKRVYVLEMKPAD